MKVLVVGSGGREHALAWRLAQSAQVDTVFVAPGNGGTAMAGGKLQNVAVSGNEALLAFARENGVGLTVVGPEAPLAEGLVDVFRAAGLAIFGPTQAAAQLESSKAYAKDFMARHAIPTAAYATFTDAAAAHDYLDTHPAPIVIKADGLAAGKGVVVAMSDTEAHEAVDMIFGGALGLAGARVVIEEFLAGEEASFIVLCDGKNVVPLATSQDHKRLGDGDKGPNTGGMGAYSPAPVVSSALHTRIMNEVIHPVLAGMEKDGVPFTGFLYAGLMIGDGDDASRAIKVLEFNCRMGDPETQPIMMRLQSDLAEVLLLATQGMLDTVTLQWDPRPALGVVMAAAGYPGTPKKGTPIRALPQPSSDCVVFHAGTTVKDGEVLSSGGRVLCVTALGQDLHAARDAAYAAVDAIDFPEHQHRRDIGWRAL